MGRAPCCDKMGVKRGPWSPEEDLKLVSYILKHGHGNWRALPKLAGLLRCGKSCRLRWTNYLRPDIKRGHFSPEEEQQIIQLHAILGNRWSTIASHLPGRTDNEIKNVWNTHLKKRLMHSGMDPHTHALPANTVNAQQRSSSSSPSNMALSGRMNQLGNASVEAEARDPMNIINRLGLANSKAEVNSENAYELKGESSLCIDSREMDYLLQQALDFPSIEIKPDQDIMFDGSIRKACSISYSPNSACISSPAPNESSISTVETDDMSHLQLAELVPDCHDLHSKLFDNDYNPVEDESFGVDEMFLLGGEDREKCFQRFNSTSYAKLQYNNSGLEDTTAAAASAFRSQMPFWQSQNAGTLDDRLPSACNASCTHQRVGQIMGEDGSNSTAHLCPNTSSIFCAADVLRELPDDSSKVHTVDFDEVCQDNFWMGVLKRVGPTQSPFSYAIN